VFQSEVIAWFFALIVGAIGALLALFFQKIAVALAGFMMGGFTVSYFLEYFQIGPQSIIWLLFFISGILGALFVLYLFDWGLIFLSSIAGALTLLKGLPNDILPKSLIFLVLAFSGIVIQAFMFSKSRVKKEGYDHRI
jgi:hypothetical protein